LKFATVDYHDPGAGGTASTIKLTAYLNSTTSTPIGATTTYGTFSTDTYPQGTLSFNSSTPFDVVTIELPFMQQGAAVFLVDNITVTTTLSSQYGNLIL
jgi:hypothetical protein